jgi:hypothetical protein
LTPKVKQVDVTSTEGEKGKVITPKVKG